MTPPDDYAGLIPFLDRHEKEQAEFLGALLYDTLLPSSVVDWGCASGLYLVPFRNFGCRILGIDADNASGGQLEEEESVLVDIRQPYDLLSNFDLALCIETAEHIQPEYADQLVENVAASADTVFWSAAHPGQGGLYHWNEQLPGYWLSKFMDRGFQMHPQHDGIKRAIRLHPACQRVEWLLPNAMLLTRAI